MKYPLCTLCFSLYSLLVYTCVFSFYYYYYKFDKILNIGHYGVCRVVDYCTWTEEIGFQNIKKQFTLFLVLIHEVQCSCQYHLDVLLCTGKLVQTEDSKNSLECMCSLRRMSSAWIVSQQATCHSFLYKVHYRHAHMQSQHTQARTHTLEGSTCYFIIQNIHAHSNKIPNHLYNY